MTLPQVQEACQRLRLRIGVALLIRQARAAACRHEPDSLYCSGCLTMIGFGGYFPFPHTASPDECAGCERPRV
jgi:hypothetical protein